jgi:hypothetical protein
MKIQFRIWQDGKVFEGEAVLTEGQSSKTPKSSPGKSKGSLSSGDANKPSGALDRLYRKRFFASERTLGTVLDQLQEDGYNFSAPSILMALKSRGYLQRRGSKGSYRFVQKFPPTS